MITQEQLQEIEAQTLFAISSPTGRHIGLWKDRDVALAVLAKEPVRSTMQELVPVSALQEEQGRSSQIAAWQCIHTDGKTGIVCDEHGNQSCAKDAIIASLTDRVARLEAALQWYGEQARLCRLIHNEGDKGRHALSNDGGKRARSALEETK